MLMITDGIVTLLWIASDMADPTYGAGLSGQQAPP
jgi:hypothetical protein